MWKRKKERILNQSSLKSSIMQLVVPHMHSARNACGWMQDEKKTVCYSGVYSFDHHFKPLQRFLSKLDVSASKDLHAVFHGCSFEKKKCLMLQMIINKEHLLVIFHNRSITVFFHAVGRNVMINKDPAKTNSEPPLLNNQVRLTPCCRVRESRGDFPKQI